MIIDYNMSKDYCADWSAIDAIREMVQNAIDSGQKYECKITENTIEVITYDTDLPLNTLMLGESIKDNGAIGKYGEGYKIGMLVLTREGLMPLIYSNDSCINGLFSRNQFDVDTFKLQIEKLELIRNNITFKCMIGDINIEELKHKIPAFTGENPPIPTNIDIWQDKPGQIFVNGLYVTEDKDLVFGYNFSPSKIQLNRDRNMVNGIYWQLASYYNSLGESNAQLIFNLVERDAADVKDLYFHLTDSKLKAELARLFYNKYGDGATISKPGTSYYSGGSGVSCSTSASRVYGDCGVKETKKTIDPEAPDQVILQWLKDNKKFIRKEAKVSLKSMINRAKGWSKASIY